MNIKLILFSFSISLFVACKKDQPTSEPFVNPPPPQKYTIPFTITAKGHALYVVSFKRNSTATIQEGHNLPWSKEDQVWIKCDSGLVDKYQYSGNISGDLPQLDPGFAFGGTFSIGAANLTHDTIPFIVYFIRDVDTIATVNSKIDSNGNQTVLYFSLDGCY